MNLRNWSKQHTLGLLIGIVTTLISLPIVMFIYSKVYKDPYVWFRFFEVKLKAFQSQMLSLACITNLIWFHLSMRREKFALGMGIIMATVISLFVILFLKFS
ncbi:MAG: hypothetical protein PHQ74_00360 [Crocinitomicaceae bacterium]|nr:hypothetical protein [Crocinitomicaceae bacterium]